MTRVACCELAPVLGDLNANLAAATEAIGDAAAAGADIIVLPELATSGYCFGCAEEAQAPVVRTPAGLVGLFVCYDLAFPEMYRSLAVRGAQLVAAPVNWPRSGHPVGLPCSEVLIAMASARVNRMVIACCDRRGTERGQEWNQASTIIGSDGWVLATAGERGQAVADVDLALTADKKLSARNDLLGDRRPELY